MLTPAGWQPEAIVEFERALRFELDGIQPARWGDYRVLYVIDDADSAVTVVAI